MSTERKSFRVRSYVRRDSRRTKAQERAYQTLFPQFGLELSAGLIDFAHVFGRVAPCFLEIGFGSGQSLLALAKAYPERDFIGIETHKPAIGALLLGMQIEKLTNIRLYHVDAIDVLQQCIPEASLHGIQIFFPDPWPKRRHHPRRLIQSEFVKLLSAKLKIGGALHLATDWEDYAQHMMKTLSHEKNLINLASLFQFATRSPLRPILTKFESRAAREGRGVWELQFGRVS